MTTAVKGTPHFYRNFLKLSVPVTLQSFLVAVISVSDAAMLGQFSSDALSAVSIASQISLIFTSLIHGLAVGTSALASQYWGKKDEGAVRRVMYLTLQITMAIGLVFFVTTFFFSRTVMGC